MESVEGVATRPVKIKDFKRDPKRKARRTREERSEEIRQNLIQAGARIVGRYGYEKASVARITAKARVALGTFYRHFRSRQEFFDQLLPAMGDRLMLFIRSRVDAAAVGAEREEQRLKLTSPSWRSIHGIIGCSMNQK